MRHRRVDRPHTDRQLAASNRVRWGSHIGPLAVLRHDPQSAPGIRLEKSSHRHRTALPIKGVVGRVEAGRASGLGFATAVRAVDRTAGHGRCRLLRQSIRMTPFGLRPPASAACPSPLILGTRGLVSRWEGAPPCRTGGRPRQRRSPRSANASSHQQTVCLLQRRAISGLGVSRCQPMGEAVANELLFVVPVAPVLFC